MSSARYPPVSRRVLWQHDLFIFNICELKFLAGAGRSNQSKNASVQPLTVSIDDAQRNNADTALEVLMRAV
jgi:hypothetical protein